MNRATTAALIAAVLPLVAVPTAGAAASLLPSGPATVLLHGPVQDKMPTNLQGDLCNGSKVCQTVPYSPLILLLTPGFPLLGLEPNVAALNDKIESTAGKQVVFAYSGGARSAYGWMQEHAEDADAPSTDDLSFVLIGNPTRKYGGSNTIIGGPVMDPYATKYDTLDITQQYDFIGDFPQDPFNMLALANAVAGFVYEHLNYTNVNVDDPNNYVWTEGKVTYVFVPTENLPLLDPLRQIGLSALADALNAPLKAIVEQGYDRDWLPTTTQGGLPGTATETAKSTQLRTLNLATNSVGVQPGEGSEGSEGKVTELATGTELADEVQGGITQTVGAASGSQGGDAAAAAAAAAGTKVSQEGAQSDQQGSPGDGADASPGNTTTVAPSTPSSGASSNSTNPGHLSGPKHRLPRTALRDKLFPKQSKDETSATVAKANEAGTGDAGASDAGK